MPTLIGLPFNIPKTIDRLDYTGTIPPKYIKGLSYKSLLLRVVTISAVMKSSIQNITPAVGSELSSLSRDQEVINIPSIQKAGFTKMSDVLPGGYTNITR
jgi:hypothetical protein